MGCLARPAAAAAWSRQRPLSVRAESRRKNEMQSLVFTRRDADRKPPRSEPAIGAGTPPAPTGAPRLLPRALSGWLRSPIAAPALTIAPRRRRRPGHAAFQQAAALQALTKGRVSLDLALFAITEQPALAAMPPPLLARRIQALSGALNIKQADAAHLLATNPALARLQPYECAAPGAPPPRCLPAVPCCCPSPGPPWQTPLPAPAPLCRLNAKVQALAAALQLGTLEVLHAVARDTRLLERTPLQLEAAVAALGAALGLPRPQAAALAQLQPLLLRVRPEALPPRAEALARLLGLEPGGARLLALLQEQPELLLPPAASVEENAAQLALALEGQAGPERLRAWLLRAPLLAVTPAALVAERLAALPGLLQQQPGPEREGRAPRGERQGRRRQQQQQQEEAAAAGGPAAWGPAADYVDLDPRVLLLSGPELLERLAALPTLLGTSRQAALRLARAHPRHLCIEPGECRALLLRCCTAAARRGAGAALQRGWCCAAAGAARGPRPAR
jgi:hypothetical protein